MMIATHRQTGTLRIPTLAAAVLLLAAAAGAQDLPRGSAGTVTISRSDYDRMLDLSARDTRPGNVPPLAAALTRTEIRARVDTGTVRATMQVDGEVFRTGSVKVPLITGATLIEARLAGGALPLILEGTTHVAVMSGPSTFSATLEWGAPLTITPGRGSFVMPVPQAGSATATFDVPGEQTDVRIAPGLILRRTSANGRTVVEATLDPGAATEVWWSRRESAPTAAPRDTRLLADVKTLVTIGDADLRLLTLIDLTVVQGEPREIEIRIPAGFEITRVTGASLERSEERPGAVALFVTNPAQRRHQFLVSLERAGGSGSFKLQTGFATLPAAQRETGEVAVEGLGTLAVAAAEIPGLRRIDAREIDGALTSAARQPILAAFRYQRVADAPPSLALDVTRYPDAAVLAAVAERAVATTLVTSEGRALTEMVLWVRNRAQPFAKVALPAGASMLSVEVAGQTAKPVEGKDGIRVPLLRPGFRPDGPYIVSFVYLNAGLPFDKKGNMQMTLPKMDLAISVVEWELFVPDRYRVDHFDGNAIDAGLIAPFANVHAIDGVSGIGYGVGMGYGLPSSGLAAGTAGGRVGGDAIAAYGQIAGRVVDGAGASLAGATITAQTTAGAQTVVADASGTFIVSNVPSGPVTLTGQVPGFLPTRRSFVFDQRPRQADMVLQVGGVSESVTVTAEPPLIQTFQSSTTQRIDPGQNVNTTADSVQRRNENVNAPSANVQSLQRRAAGVLPVRIEVPRAGSSHRFIKPLVVEEETVVSFRYKRVKN
jgi:hypothetical protein